jgi:hypothetical protein
LFSGCSMVCASRKHSMARARYSSDFSKGRLPEKRLLKFRKAYLVPRTVRKPT